MSISILSDDEPRIAWNTDDDGGLPIQYRITKWTGTTCASKEEVPNNLRKSLTLGVVRKGRCASRTTERDGHDLACILACLDIWSEERAVRELSPGKDPIARCTTRLRKRHASTVLSRQRNVMFALTLARFTDGRPPVVLNTSKKAIGIMLTVASCDQVE